MIISASRRTDIPRYYSDWFLNRLKEGNVYVRNPMNYHQISDVCLSKDVVDCIVFWTKNPINMIPKLEQLKDYMYYFQYTITGYDTDVEEQLPSKEDVLIPAFIKLSTILGKDRVIWRYDPILFTQKYSVGYHLHTFERMAKNLKGYTDKVIISFLDYYTKITRNMNQIGTYELESEELYSFVQKLVMIANENHMKVESCAELTSFESIGVTHGSCIDQRLIETLIGSPIDVRHDKNQRTECGCVESIDIGCYNTCNNGCKYCYANYSEPSVKSNLLNYDVNSPLLCSQLLEEDKINKRKVQSLKAGQLRLEL